MIKRCVSVVLTPFCVVDKISVNAGLSFSGYLCQALCKFLQQDIIFENANKKRQNFIYINACIILILRFNYLELIQAQ